MIYSVTVLTPSTAWVMTHSTLRAALSYAESVMSASNDATDIVVFRVSEGASALVKRYRRNV